MSLALACRLPGVSESWDDPPARVSLHLGRERFPVVPTYTTFDLSCQTTGYATGRFSPTASRIEVEDAGTWGGWPR